MITNELPLYRCHKEIRAAKVLSVEEDKGCLVLLDYGPMPVSVEYFNKHKPQVGGYYVRYADGYESWSPAEAFESGYNKIEG